MHPACPNKIIYKTASSDGPNSGSGKPSQNRLPSKGASVFFGCILFFLHLVFSSKIREIDHIVIPSEVVCLRSYPPQFLKNAPFHTMIQQSDTDSQSKTIILCSICTHTLAQKHLIELLMWNASDVQRQLS